MVWPSTNPIKLLIRRVSSGSPPSTRIFVLGLFVSMLFTSKEFDFGRPDRLPTCAGWKCNWCQDPVEIGLQHDSGKRSDSDPACRNIVGIP